MWLCAREKPSAARSDQINTRRLWKRNKLERETVVVVVVHSYRRDIIMMNYSSGEQLANARTLTAKVFIVVVVVVSAVNDSQKTTEIFLSFALARAASCNWKPEIVGVGCASPKGCCTKSTGVIVSCAADSKNQGKESKEVPLQQCARPITAIMIMIMIMS